VGAGDRETTLAGRYGLTGVNTRKKNALGLGRDRGADRFGAGN